MAELSNEVAHDADSKAVKEKNLANEPEVHVWHLDIAVHTLALEVRRVGPDENDQVVDEKC